jgi:proteasome lid subunit RPN8/RPN11
VTAVLVVAQRAADEVAAACERALPFEAAGFLLGRRRAAEPPAGEVAVLCRSAGRQGEFAVPDHELLRISAYAYDRRLQIVALFHSHPSGDRRLSAADRSTLRYSAWPWVLATPIGPSAGVELTAYRAGDGAPMPCRIAALDSWQAHRGGPHRRDP